MSDLDADEADDQFARLLERYEAALAAGRAVDFENDPAIPAALRPRLRAAIAGLRRLADAWTGGPPDTRASPTTDDTAHPARERLRPTRIGRYEIEDELGHGGMGVVYQAWQPDLKRRVALKMIRAGAFASTQEVQRFRTEAEAIARLQHPNVVQIFEIGEFEGQPFFALEYLEGGSLALCLAGRPQPVRWAVELVATLARAVQHAHERGIIHRDLKPANVLLATPAAAPDVPCAPAAVKVSDFGLAKQLDANTTQTQTGAVIGTPSYMGSEQAHGRVEVGPATDVHALGAILYELLTGRPPFRGETFAETLDQVRAHDAMPPRRLRGDVPPALETVCLKCLEKDPHRRYLSARALAEDLQRWLAGEAIRARRPWLVRARRFVRRHAVPVGAAAVVLAVLTSLAVVPFRGGEAPGPQEPAERQPPDVLSGRPLQLLGADGLPWFRQCFNPARVVPGTNPFSVATHDPVLLDLLPVLDWPRYRFRADFRVLQGTGGTTVGLYFARQERHYLGVPEHWFCCLRFHNNQDRLVELEVHRLREPGMQDPGIDHASKLTDFRLPATEGSPWRQMAVEVRPEGFQAYWDGDYRCEASGLEVSDRLTKTMPGVQPYLDARPLAYTSRGALGVYVAYGRVDFRQIWVEPLP